MPAIAHQQMPDFMSNGPGEQVGRVSTGAARQTGHAIGVDLGNERPDQPRLLALAQGRIREPLQSTCPVHPVHPQGLVERAEASGAVAERFALFDYNRDDVVNGAELARGSVSDVHLPTTTYTDRHTVTLGGKRVTMTYLGTAHSDDSSVLHLPDERAVFSADILQIKRLPGGLAPPSARGSTR